VTRERLYLDAIQTVYGNSNKVMVDVEGGNNVMYLPLDKMTGGSTIGGSRAMNVDSSNIRELTNAVTEQLRRDAAAAGSRGRGGR
jgi:membrane protease subunit HflK